MLELGSGYSSDFIIFFKELFSQVDHVYVFNPSFARSPCLGPDKKTIYLPNVGLRIPLNEKFDLVLMSDIKPDGDLNRFVIKGLNLIESTSDHLGEIDCKGPFYYLLPSGSSKQWFDKSGSPTLFLLSKVNNVINIDFLERMQKEYIVSDIQSTTNLFFRWFEFVRIRKQRLKNKIERKFPLKSLDVKLIYTESHRIVTGNHDPNNYGFDNWFTEFEEGRKPKLIITFVHKVSELSVTEDYIKRFNAMTHEPVLISITDVDENGRKRSVERSRRAFYHVHGNRMAPPRITTMKNRTYNSIIFTVSYEISPEDYGYRGPLQLYSEMQDEFKSGMFAIGYDGSGEWAVLERQSNALYDVYNGDVSNPYLSKLLFSPESVGSIHSAPQDKYYGNLNKKQKEAVDGCMSTKGIYLIQGPPGTGKTQVIAEITEQEVRKGHRVIIASESNQAVDNAFDRLYHSPYIRLLRVIPDRKRFSNPYSIENILSNFYRNISEHLRLQINRLPDLDEHYQIMNESMEALKKHRRKIRDILKFGFGEKYLIAFNKELDILYSELDEKKPEPLFDKIRSTIEELKTIDVEEVLNTESSTDSIDSDIEVLSSKNEEMMNSILEDFEVYDTIKKESDNLVKELLEKWGFDYNNDTLRDAIDRLTSVKEGNTDSDNIVLNQLKECHSSIVEWIDSLGQSDTIVENLIDLSDTVNGMLEKLDSITDVSDIAGFKRDIDTAIDHLFNLLDAAEAVNQYQIVLDRFTTMKNQLRMLGLPALKRMAYQDIIEYLSQKNRYSEYNLRYTRELIDHVNVFGLTCTSKQMINDGHLGINRDLTDITADVVILDEVSKIPFAQLLQPLTHAKKVILVGDHKQLPPLYTPDVDDPTWEQSEEFKRKENDFVQLFDYPYFKIVFESIDPTHKTFLDTQYRMHPQIMDADNQFYDGALKCGVSDSDRAHNLKVIIHDRVIIKPDNHIVFINHDGKESKSSDSHSMHNSKEVSIIKSLVLAIHKCCETDRNGEMIKTAYAPGEDTRLSIGIITPYRDQADRIISACYSKKTKFNEDEDQSFEIRTVDDFQGDERDIIILSMVRSRPFSRFLMDFRRVNVAMSRARRLLVIVGNARSLEKTTIKMDPKSDEDVPVYKHILDVVRANNGFVDWQEDSP